MGSRLSFFSALEKAVLRAVKGIHRLFRGVPWLKEPLYLLEGVLLRLMEQLVGFFTPPEDYPNFRLGLIRGTFEPQSVAYLRSRIEKGMVVLDVGAHVGYYTRLLADLVGAEGIVVALEPNPRNFTLLRRNLAYRKNVRLFALAAAPEEGKLDLLVPARATGWGRLSLSEGVLDTHLQQGGNLARYVVQAKPLAGLIEELGLQGKKIGLLKVDVEGAELMVLASLGEAISQVEEVLCELSSANQRAFGYAPGELLIWLEERGFRYFQLLDPVAGEGEPYPLQGFQREREWLSGEEVRQIFKNMVDWPPDLVVNLLASRRA